MGIFSSITGKTGINIEFPKVIMSGTEANATIAQRLSFFCTPNLIHSFYFNKSIMYHSGDCIQKTIPLLVTEETKSFYIINKNTVVMDPMTTKIGRASCRERVDM